MAATRRASQVVQTLKQRKVDANLAGVRDPEALAKLPEPERKEWQSLWADVDSPARAGPRAPREGRGCRESDAGEGSRAGPKPHRRGREPPIAPQDLAQSYINQGLTGKAVPLLLTASAADPNDTLLSLKVAALQAWFGQEKELAATRQRILTFAKGTDDRWTAAQRREGVQYPTIYRQGGTRGGARSGSRRGEGP